MVVALDLRETAAIESCSVPDCQQPACACLNLRSYCLQHFISTCYEQLNEIKHWLDGMHSRMTSADSIQYFLTECARHTSALAQAQDPNSLEQNRLLDILQRAAGLTRRLRA